MLFAQGTQSDQNLYKLDETTLGSAFPSTKLTIQSEDPHSPPRTRADKPFTVSLQIKSLAHPASMVSIHHQGNQYNPSTHSPKTLDADQDFGWWTISKPRNQQGSFYPSLPAPDLTQVEGTETFTVYSHHSDPATKPSGSASAIPLGSASIQIWPVATATINGITTDSTISQAQLKQPVNISCQDLYPDSVTYVQIYRGDAKLGTKGTVLPQSVIRFDTSVPQDQLIPLGEWRDTLVDGKYTIEVLTITPFNQGKPERLAHTTFVIDRGMHSPGMVRSTR